MIDRDRKEILLKEYEICQQDSQAESSSFWTIFGIFISINTLIIGGLAYGLFNTNFVNEVLNVTSFPNILTKLTILTILFAAIILIIQFLQSWLGRTNYLIQNNNHRMHEIEIELGMWKNLEIHILDKWNSERKKLKYKTNPYKSQNINIWVCVWRGLSTEFSKDHFDSLYKEKTRVESIINQKNNTYFRPNRYNAAYIFWAIRSLWVILLTSLWALFFSNYLKNWSLLMYIPPGIGILIERYIDIRRIKGAPS